MASGVGGGGRAWDVHAVIHLNSALQTGYPLRPEHAESLFYTHRALGGDEWLHAGRDVLRSLQQLRVPCGVAALQDVNTRKQVVTRQLRRVVNSSEGFERHDESRSRLRCHAMNG